RHAGAGGDLREKRAGPRLQRCRTEPTLRLEVEHGRQLARLRLCDVEEEVRLRDRICDEPGVAGAPGPTEVIRAEVKSGALRTGSIDRVRRVDDGLALGCVAERERHRCGGDLRTMDRALPVRNVEPARVRPYFRGADSN